MGQADENPGALAHHCVDVSIPCQVAVKSYTEIPSFSARCDSGLAELNGKFWKSAQILLRTNGQNFEF